VRKFDSLHTVPSDNHTWRISLWVHMKIVIALLKNAIHHVK